MKQLFETDCVIYDKANDHVIQFSNGDIVIYGDNEEAIEDCKNNEEIVKCTELSEHWKKVLLNQINYSV